MSKAIQLLEFMGFITHEPSDQEVHKVTHHLVHSDATRHAREHAEKFRVNLQDKGLKKNYVTRIVTHAEKDAYQKHYRKAYTGVRREVHNQMRYKQ